jgi:hypothetical protein
MELQVSIRVKHLVVRALLDRYPQTFGEDLGIRRLDRPAPLFHLLVMSLLMSARIRWRVAFNAARALLAAGWTTPSRMVEAGWNQRTRTLNAAGYARYDGRTSTMLGATAQVLIDQYGGDLRRLREAAHREPLCERELLEEFKGIGDVGVDIFFREVQVAWPEVYPFADRRALASAQRLDLGASTADLARLAERMDFVRLVSALVRVDLDHAHDAVLAAAGASSGREDR